MLSKTKKLNILVQTVSADDDHMPDFVYTITMDKRLVMESLEEDVALWTPSSPVMLDFPTGTGKNYFVTQVVVPRAIAEDKNVLILSNRVALSVQQKLSMMKPDDPRRICLTPEGIRRLEDLGNVRVLTYQRLAALIRDTGNKEWIRNLKYVIADEAHFFVADAKFNTDCGYLLKLVTSRFCHAVRLYLTATSWDILFPLCEAEKRNYLDLRPYKEWEPPRSLIRYWIEPDYNGLTPVFFTEYSDLIEEIRRKQPEKWIVFVDSKKDGRMLQDHLDDLAQYLDADEKGSHTWNQIVETERFDAQVLITTSVLDNGVNIRDDSVQNIAVVSDDRTAIIQSIGRKRRRPGEAVNVWIRIDEKQISKRYARCRELVQWEEKFSCCCSLRARQDFLGVIWEQDDARLRKLFIPCRNDLFINELAFYSIRRKEKFYENIISGRTTFKAEALRWLNALPKEVPPLDAQLKDFYQQYGKTVLSESLFSELRDIIVNTYILAGFKEPQPQRVSTLMDKALNNRLESLRLPYRIQVDEGKRFLTVLEEEN